VWDRRIDNLITTAPIDESMPNRPPPEFSRTYINVPDEVKATGAEALLRGAITEAVGFDLSYTYSKELNSDGTRRVERPLRTYKASLSYSPPGRPFGINVAYKYVGDQTDPDVNGFGAQSFGDYSVVNVGAHLFVDPARQRHRLGLRLENAFDAEYSTLVGSAVLEGSDPQERFLWNRIAPPRTVHMNYSYSF
jgi:outer membrane cobalamin receptor